MTGQPRRLVIVVRADPVICGHSGEARNLAEAALARGFDEVRIVTWPIERLIESGLPLKPLDGVAPYSEGIVVERPEAVGDYKVPDGRYLSGLTGRLVELFTDGVPTVAMSLYLTPAHHRDHRRRARGRGDRAAGEGDDDRRGGRVRRHERGPLVCRGEQVRRRGPRAVVLPELRHPALPSRTTPVELIIESAEAIDARHGTHFAAQCQERVTISYPAIDTTEFLDPDPFEVESRLARRGLTPGSYVLFLSRLAHAKGVDDLIDGFAASRACDDLTLVIAGNGPEAQFLREYAAASTVADRLVFLDDVDDDEKSPLMAGCAAFVLPSKPRPEFIETFGIALVEKMLSGGGPVITTDTGGIGEAVGDTALIVDVNDPAGIASALDRALAMSLEERDDLAHRARNHAMQFDRALVLDRLLGRLEQPDVRELYVA